MKGNEVDPGAPPANAAASAGRLEFQTTNLWAGAFVLGALVLFSTLALMSLRDRILEGEYRLNATFPRIEGLRTGAEVQLRGTPSGRVKCWI